MTLKKQAFTGIYWSLIDKVINQLFYALVIIFLANKLGPEAFGLIGMLTVFVLMSESIVNCGFAQALVQRSKKVTTEEESTVFYINLFIAIVLYLILFFVAPYIAIFYNETELIEISRVLFLALIINAFSIVPRAKLTIKVDFRSQAIANLVGTIIGSIVAVIMASHNYGYWALVGLSLVKGIGVTIGLWIYSKWRP